VRGVERSRPVASVLAEVGYLLSMLSDRHAVSHDIYRLNCWQVQALADQGVREVVLLGQTVNSYWDQGTPSDPAWRARLSHLRVAGEGDEPPQEQQHSEHDHEGDGTHQYKGYEVAEGFTQRSKPKKKKNNSNDTNDSDPEGGVSIVAILIVNCYRMTDMLPYQSY